MNKTEKVKSVISQFWQTCLTKPNLTRGELMVCIATTQIGKCDDQNPPGSGVFPPGQIDYTNGNPEYWCSEFVSWVHHAANYSYSNSEYGDDLDWLLASVGELTYFYDDRSSYSGDFGYLVNPTPGSWVSLNNGNHSGLVVAVDAGDLYTIEGNVGGCVVAKVHEDFANTDSIMGFGMDNCVPEFNDSVSSFSGKKRCTEYTNGNIMQNSGYSWSNFQEHVGSHLNISKSKFQYPSIIKTGHDSGSNTSIYPD